MQRSNAQDKENRGIIIIHPKGIEASTSIDREISLAPLPVENSPRQFIIRSLSHKLISLPLKWSSSF